MAIENFNGMNMDAFMDSIEAEYDTPMVPQPEQTDALLPPVIRTIFKDLVQGADVMDECKNEITFDISFFVEVYCPNECKVLDSGVVVKKIRLSKQSLATELLTKSNSTPITEATIETVKQEVREGATDAAQQQIRRMRELAGIPAKGNWI